MKIIHVIIGLNVGGAELMLKRLVEGLSEHEGVKHSIISLTDLGIVGEQLQDLGVNVVALGMTGFFNLPRTFLRLRGELENQKPDIVQTWMYHADFLGGLAARSLGFRKIVWGVRNTYLESSGRVNYIFRRLCGFLSYFLPKEIIYVSNSAKDQHQISGYNTKIGKVINNGFDTDKYKYNKSSRHKSRSLMRVKEEDFVVLSIGRYTEAKDHSSFINAILLAVKENSQIKACLVGRDICLDRFGLTDNEKENFIVLGQRDDIEHILCAADVFCLHSITEGFPNVLGEAMSVGIPCISTDVGDAALMLNDDRYVVNPKDVQGLAEKIVLMSRLTGEQRNIIGSRNRERVKQFFSLEKILSEYLLVYKNLG